MLTEEGEKIDLEELLSENKKLLVENNQLLKKLHRATIWAFWVRIVWFFFIIGAPFVLYFYVIEPYFDSLGSSFETFQQGLQEVPGWKQFYETVAGGEGDE